MTLSSLINYKEESVTLSQYTFASGETLSNLRIAYSTFGTAHFNESGKITNAVLLLHGTSGTAANWFVPSLMSSLFVNENPINQRDYYFIVPDALGAGRSSKPSDSMEFEFPKYGYHDMVEVVYETISVHFPITKLHAVIGTSMGGMHTWLLALKYPEFIRRAVAIACMPYEISGRNLLWRKIILENLQSASRVNDPSYLELAFKNIWPLFSMMTDSATHLQQVAPNRSTTLKFFEQLSVNAGQLNPIDMYYRLSASYDYNPYPQIGQLSIPMLMINFSDDLLTPVKLIDVDHLTQLTNNLTINIFDSIDKYSFGHQNLSQGKIWGWAANQFIS